MAFLWLNNIRIDSLPELKSFFRNAEKHKAEEAFAELKKKTESGVLKKWLSHQFETCRAGSPEYINPRKSTNILRLIDYTPGQKLDSEHIRQLCSLCSIDIDSFDFSLVERKEKEQKADDKKIKAVIGDTQTDGSVSIVNITDSDYTVVDNAQLSRAIADRIDNPHVHKVIYICAQKNSALPFTLNLTNVKNTQFVGVDNPKIYYSPASTQKIDAEKNRLTFENITISCYGEARIYNADKSVNFNQAEI